MHATVEQLESLHPEQYEQKNSKHSDGSDNVSSIYVFPGYSCVMEKCLKKKMISFIEELWETWSNLVQN